MDPLPYPEFVRRKMLELRKSRGFAQVDFGTFLGLTSQTISSLELGKHEWSLSHMDNAIKTFRLPGTFFNRDADPNAVEPADLSRESSALVHKLATLSPKSRGVLSKYLSLPDEQRLVVDKLILTSYSGRDDAVIQALLVLLNRLR